MIQQIQQTPAETATRENQGETFLSAGDTQPLLVRLMSEATAAQERGDSDRAEARYRRLTDLYPRFPDAWHYYGLLMHQRGDHERGLELMRRAEKLDPDNLVFLLNLATVLREQRQLEDGLDVLRRAHAISPEHGQVLAQAVQISLLLNRGGELIEEVQKRIVQLPENWHLRMLLGDCLEQGGERDRAIEAFVEAARLAPHTDKIKAHLRRGWVARGAGNLSLAESAFRAAADIDPGSSWAVLGLAQIAAEQGDFGHAARLARKAVELDSSCYSAWRLLVNIDEHRNDPSFLEELEATARKAGDDPRAWQLHFARGQVWEKRGNYDRAFAAYALGNTQHSRNRPYSREVQDAYTEDIITHLDARFVNRVHRVGMETPGAIFVCGMPRSGTTLVETILATHPDVSAGGEMRHIHDQLRRRMRPAPLPSYLMGSWLAGASDTDLRELGQGWRTALDAAAQGKPRVTDKMPGNFALLGLIHACLRGARIVHVRRDPRDNAFSCFATPFAEGLEFSYVLEDIAHFYHSYTRLMAHWRRVLGADRIIEIEYESLVGDPESEIRRLLAALGLDWDPHCLEFHKKSRTVSTASVYQVRQPIYHRSIRRWRHFEPHLPPLLKALEENELQ